MSFLKKLNMDIFKKDKKKKKKRIDEEKGTAD
jgi:hypothetical protein